MNLAGATGAGYRVLTSGGGLSAFGAAGYGQAATGQTVPRAVSVATDPDTGGYWVLRADGSVLNYHAPWHGSPRGRVPPRQSVTAITGT